MSKLLHLNRAFQIASSGLEDVELTERFRVAATFKDKLQTYDADKKSEARFYSKAALNQGLVDTLRSIRHSDALEQAYDKVRTATIARAESMIEHPRSLALSLTHWDKMSGHQRMNFCWGFARSMPDRLNENLPFEISSSYAAKAMNMPPQMVTDIVTGQTGRFVQDVEAKPTPDYLGFMLRVNKNAASDFSNGLVTLTHLFGESINLSLLEISKPQHQIRAGYHSITPDMDILDNAKKFGMDYRRMPLALGEAYQEHFTVRMVNRQMDLFAQGITEMLDRNAERIRNAKHRPGLISRFLP